MARARNQRNGRLEDALTTLIQNQSSFVQNQAAFQAQIAETNREMAQIRRESAELQRQINETNRLNSERFARIEAILREHSRILEALPDAIRDKIGFRPPERPRGTS